MADSPQNRSKDPSLSHLPPQSIEAEESLLSAILIDNEALFDVVEVLGADDFYRPAHQKIFSAITNLFDKREPIDLVTLTTHLRNINLLEDIGGAAYLSNLVSSVPMAVNPRHYAGIIHEKAVLRRLIQRSNEITRRCYEHQGEVDEVINFAESSIFEISEDKIKPAFYPVEKLVIDNLDELEERKNNKSLLTGVPTGYTQLDQMTAGLQKSDLIILAARPSMGKTAFALNIARNAAVDGKVPVAVFSLEMSKEQLSMRMLCAESRVDSSKLRSGFFSNDDYRKLTDAADAFSQAPIYIDDSPSLGSMDVRTKSRRLKMEKGLGLIIIDYIQLMRSRTISDRRDLEISEISRSLKGLAKELNVPVIALSQLNRKLEERSDKRPQLSDLRESGALEQDADVVAFIYRDEVYNKEENNPNINTAEIIVAKQRNGPIGTARLAFLKSYTRFENLASSDYYDGS
ncbi:MAG: replicative DNA helicase [Desulfobacterales bacterium]|jgi:replicative DNA helicase|nr:replicative DNA helicase [Desulfobacterales bacterium]